MTSDSEFQVPRRSASLRVLVEEQLRKAIVVGRFRPGDRLIERELCDLFGVGRTSVREALRQLEAEGLVTSYPHRGPVVSKIDVEEARQLYDVRGLLEGYCGRRFAEHGGAEEIAALREAYAAFAEAAEGSDREALIATKTAFYDRLMAGAGNLVVRRMLETLHNRITLLRMTSMTQPGRIGRSVAEVGAIVEAIAAKDPDAADAACRDHIERAAGAALARLSEEAQDAE